MAQGWQIHSSPCAPPSASGIALYVRRGRFDGSLKSRSAKRPSSSKVNQIDHRPSFASKIRNLCLTRPVMQVWLKSTQQQQLLRKKNRSLIKAQKKASLTVRLALERQLLISLIDTAAIGTEDPALLVRQSCRAQGSRNTNEQRQRSNAPNVSGPWKGNRDRRLSITRDAVNPSEDGLEPRSSRARC